MERVSLDGLELAYDVYGAGEPVVLIHHGAGIGWFAPLLAEPALARSHLVVTYHRAGYGESGPVAGPISFVEEAAHCRALIDHLGLERVHVLGHSSSAMIALQLALDAPDAVHTLALLESARPAPENERQSAFVADVVVPAIGRYRAGDTAGAIDTWLRGVCGPDYRAALERAVPDAFEQAAAAADMYFGQEVPAVQQWSFTEHDAGRIPQPVLVVLGEKSEPIFRERRELLLAWLPNVEPFELPEATHLLYVENPEGMALGLAEFLARHPLGAT